MKKKMPILIILFIVIIFFIITTIIAEKTFFANHLNNTICKDYKAVKYVVIQGTIEDVFVDKENHGSRTVKIKCDQETQYFYLNIDESGLFEFLQKEDSIAKNYNDYNVYVFRNGVSYKYKLKYGCVESNNN